MAEIQAPDTTSNAAGVNTLAAPDIQDTGKATIADLPSAQVLASMMPPRSPAPPPTAPIAPPAAPTTSSVSPAASLGASGSSHARALAQGANAIADSDPKAAAQPGGWARALLGGALTALGGVANIATGGALTPLVAAPMVKRGEKERQFQNLQEANKNESMIAHTHAQTVAAERLNQHNSIEDQKELATMGKTADDAMAANHPLVSGGGRISEDELLKNMISSENPGGWDPSKIIANRVEVSVGSDGKPQTVWNVRQRTGADREVPPEIAKRWADAGLVDQDGKPVSFAGPINGDLFDAYQKTAESRLAYQQAVRKAEEDSGLEKKTKERKDMSGKDQDMLTSYLGAHMWEYPNMDSFERLQKMSAMKDKSGQPTEIAQAAGRQLAQYDPKELDKHLEEQRKQAEVERHDRMEEINTAAKNKADKGGFTGNPDAATPEAFLQSLDPEARSIVSLIGTGRAPINRPDYILARKPEIMEAVAKAYPDFDASKIKSYQDTYKDFTSGKTSVALNSGGTALGHLRELQQLNTAASHIPHTPAWTAYQNKADTLAAELAKFYGDATIPAIESIKETLTSTLPGNREAAIRTQAQSMGDKLNSYETEWTNAAPSKAYQAPMPHISLAAKQARAALDPAYAQQHPELGVKSTRVAPTVPQGATHTYRDAQGNIAGYAVNGKFVPVGAQ